MSVILRIVEAGVAGFPRGATARESCLKATSIGNPRVSGIL